MAEHPDARDIAAALNERFAGEAFFGSTDRVRMEMNAFLAVEFPGWSVAEMKPDGWLIDIRLAGPGGAAIDLTEKLV